MKRGIAGHILQVVGQHDEVERLAHVFAAERFRQSEQAVETRCLQRERGGDIGGLGRGCCTRQRPSVHDILRQAVLGLQRTDKRGVVVGMAGSHCEALGRVTRIRLTGSHRDHLSARRTQLRGQPRTEPAAVFEHQRARRLRGRSRQLDATPHWAVEPVGHVVAALQRGFGCGSIFSMRLAGLDPVALVLERVGGQRHTTAQLAAVEGLPVDRGTMRP